MASAETTAIIDASRRAYDRATDIYAQAARIKGTETSVILHNAASRILCEDVDRVYLDGRTDGTRRHNLDPAGADDRYLAGYAHALLHSAGAYPY